MPQTPHVPKIDLQEVNTRDRTARQIIARLVTAGISEIWRYVETALSDTPVLSAEIVRLRSELDATRLDRANLAAAALATIAAHHDGEPDPLAYLRDELTAQGFTAEGRE